MPKKRPTVPQPVHVKGVTRGEEKTLEKGREPGRGEGGRGYRTARDSTTINPELREPIHPDSINIPPA